MCRIPLAGAVCSARLSERSSRKLKSVASLEALRTDQLPEALLPRQSSAIHRRELFALIWSLLRAHGEGPGVHCRFLCGNLLQFLWVALVRLPYRSKPVVEIAPSKDSEFNRFQKRPAENHKDLRVGNGPEPGLNPF
jgi:hypothetical protein